MSQFLRVGDKIRSYDWKPMDGRPECYMEGVVSAVGVSLSMGDKGLERNDRPGDMVEFKISKRVFSGADCPAEVGNVAWAPLPGAKGMLFDWDGRLVRLISPEEVMAAAEPV